MGEQYSADGEAHTALVGQESLEATVMLSAAQNTDVHYLLAWEMDLQTRNTTNSTTNSKSVAICTFLFITCKSIIKVSISYVLNSTFCTFILYMCFLLLQSSGQYWGGDSGGGGRDEHGGDESGELREA